MKDDKVAARLYQIEQATTKVGQCLTRVSTNYASNKHIMPDLIEELRAANDALAKLVGEA